MSCSPKVSVIINVRNGAATLRESLESVLRQTMTDWEIVFWDDGSSDDSPAIAREYETHRLRYFRSPGQTSLGLGPARNQALKVARGEWVAFLDQDDLWTPDKLKLQLAMGESDADVGLVYGRTVCFTPEGREFDYDHRHEFGPLPEGRIFERLWTDSCFIAISSTLMRRSMVEALGDIPPRYLVSPDYYLYLALARHHQVRAVQQVVCRYRLHAGNMSIEVRGRIQEEVLSLVGLWEADMDPRLAKRRRQVHSTVLAVQELRRSASRGRGLRRLFGDGSVAFLLSRPFAWLYRTTRRRLQQPAWRNGRSVRSGAAAT